MVTLGKVTQSLREEHRELLPHVELLRTAADSIGETSIESVRQRLDEAYGFLAHHLIPHATAEDKALYPVVGKLLGAPEATATMSRDHAEVGRLTAELALMRARLGTAINAEDAKALRRVLYGLYALVKVHFAKEEEVYLPLLDARLTPGQAHEMFEAMEAAAHEAKQGSR
jgi:hemerythrin-like domain-containing protein